MTKAESSTRELADADGFAGVCEFGLRYDREMADAASIGLEEARGSCVDFDPI
jgi:hypothetical protein